MPRFAREFLEALALAVFVFLATFISLQNFMVVGASMSETLEEGQYVVVNKLAYSNFDKARLAQLIPFWSVDEPETVFNFHPPRRGEVIVFHPPRQPDLEYVKRVVGLPGELVEIRRGQVYVDGVPVDEPYVLRKSLAETRAYPRLAAGEYFVLGDNRVGSEDSRAWGPITLDSIVGRTWFTYWPFSDAGLVAH